MKLRGGEFSTGIDKPPSRHYVFGALSVYGILFVYLLGRRRNNACSRVSTAHRPLLYTVLGMVWRPTAVQARRSVSPTRVNT